MIEIDPQKTKQFVFSHNEHYRLKLEIEDVFCKLDSTHCTAYSIKKMRQKYPVLAEILAGKINR